MQRHLRSLQYPLNSFVVYTLHGLALTIATRNPDLSGISLDTLTLLTPTAARVARARPEQIARLGLKGRVHFPGYSKTPGNYVAEAEGLSFV